MSDINVERFESLDLLLERENISSASLILGNGASIAVDEGFNYTSLYECACAEILNPQSRSLFKGLNTTDFELVMSKLTPAHRINEILEIENGCDAIDNVYDDIRNALISTIRKHHIDHDDVQPKLGELKSVLKNFKTVISLNYDLLIYWAITYNLTSDPNVIKDYFRREDGFGLEFDYDMAKTRKQYNSVFYPHGNLVLVRSSNNDELKIKKDKENLINEIDRAWSNKYTPLFVSEGTSKQKLKAIRRSPYLNFVYENVLPDLEETIVTYGWKFAKQEDHLIEKIFRSGKVKTAYISIHNPAKEDQYEIRKRLKDYNVNIEFFKAPLLENMYDC